MRRNTYTFTICSLILSVTPHLHKTTMSDRYTVFETTATVELRGGPLFSNVSRDITESKMWKLFENSKFETDFVVIGPQGDALVAGFSENSLLIRASLGI